jgi:hypothetical protein
VKLLTPDLARSIPKLGQTEGTPLLDKVAMVRFFHPASNWAWYVLEYDGEDGCWGLIETRALKLNHFFVSDLSQPLGIYHLSAQRDKQFRPTRIRDLPIYGEGRALP